MRLYPLLQLRHVQRAFSYLSVTERLELSPRQLGWICLAVFPAVHGGVAHAQFPREVLLAQPELVPHRLQQSAVVPAVRLRRPSHGRVPLLLETTRCYYI